MFVRLQLALVSSLQNSVGRTGAGGGGEMSVCVFVCVHVRTHARVCP